MLNKTCHVTLRALMSSIFTTNSSRSLYMPSPPLSMSSSSVEPSIASNSCFAARSVGFRSSCSLCSGDSRVSFGSCTSSFKVGDGFATLSCCITAGTEELESFSPLVMNSGKEKCNKYR